MTPTSVHELDLPKLWDRGIGAFDVEAARSAWDEHWLAKSRLGYVVTRHEDVNAVLRDRRFYSASSRGKASSVKKRPIILEMDGDEHTRLRRLVSPAFGARAADRLRPFMRETFEGILTPLLDRGHAEFASEVCEPYPVPVICQLLGAPKEDAPLFTRWATAINRRFDADPIPTSKPFG